MRWNLTAATRPRAAASDNLLLPGAQQRRPYRRGPVGPLSMTPVSQGGLPPHDARYLCRGGELQRPSASLHSGWHTWEVEPGFEPGCTVLQTAP